MVRLSPLGTIRSGPNSVPVKLANSRSVSKITMNSVLPANCTPAPDYKIDTALVSRLMAEQHPDLADLPLRELRRAGTTRCFGWEIAWRCACHGAAAAGLITNEQHWLPNLAKSLPLPVPDPYRIGKPAFGYPCSWNIVPWLNGMSADICEPDRTQVVAFAKFLSALHVPAPGDAPTNPVRDVPLRKHSTAIEA